MILGNIVSHKTAGVVTVDISWSLQAAAVLMMHHHSGALIVTDRGEPVGMVSERDLVSALADRGARGAGTAIREVITGPVLAVSAGESIMRAMALMTEKCVRHLPVFDNSEPIGIVSLPELIKYRLQEIELEAVSATWPPRRDTGDNGSLGSDQPIPSSRNSNVPELPTTLMF